MLVILQAYNGFRTYERGDTSIICMRLPTQKRFDLPLQMCCWLPLNVEGAPKRVSPNMDGTHK